MAWHRESSAVLRVDPDALWDALADVSRWPEWCGGLAGARPSTDGGAVDLVPSGRLGQVHRRTAPAALVLREAPHRIVVEQPQPGGCTRITLSIEDEDGNASDGEGDGSGGRLSVASALLRLHQLVEVEGPLGPLAVRGLALPVARGFREDVLRLHRLLAARGATRRPPDALTVVIAGGSGALGRRLCGDLVGRGHEVVVLTRSVDPTLALTQVEWDGRTVGPWADLLRVDPARTAVVNLAGRLVDVRPTDANIASLRASRVDPTRALVQASAGLETPLAHWLQASTTAIWGDAGEQWCDETTPLPSRLPQALPQMTGVARPWEESLAGAVADHTVVLRTSLVLDRDLPVVDRLAQVTRLGLGGPIGDGRAWVSWIHVDDWLEIARACLGLEPGLTIPSGVLVAASDHPVRNAEMMAVLRARLHRPAAPPTPALLARLGSLVLRSDPALPLTGRHATSRVLADLGHNYRFPHFDDAVADLLG